MINIEFLKIYHIRTKNGNVSPIANVVTSTKPTTSNRPSTSSTNATISPTTSLSGSLRGHRTRMMAVSPSLSMKTDNSTGTNSKHSGELVEDAISNVVNNESKSGSNTNRALSVRESPLTTEKEDALTVNIKDDQV